MHKWNLLKKTAPCILSLAVAATSFPTAVMATDLDSSIVADETEQSDEEEIAEVSDYEAAAGEAADAEEIAAEDQSAMTFDVTAFDVTLADVQAAAARIAGKVRRTPTYYSAGLSARLGVETWVKVESLQLGGSFKVRGCYNKLMGLSEAELARVRTQLKAARVYEKDSMFGQAMKIGQLEALGFSWRDDAEIDRRLDAVTPAQVQAAARRYLTDDRLTVAVLAAQATPPGQAPAAPLTEGGAHVR